RMPLDPSRRRWPEGRSVEERAARDLLQLLDRAQLQASAVRLDEPVLGGVLGCLRPAAVDGVHHRREALLTRWLPTRLTTTTSSSSARAPRGCGRRLKRRTPARPSASSASRYRGR